MMVVVAVQRAERKNRAFSRLLRAVLDKVIVCAWCRRISIAGEWREAIDEPDLLASLDDDALVTHGICPACFGRHAPGIAYPA
jgi:hypothetical protein